MKTSAFARRCLVFIGLQVGSLLVAQAGSGYVPGPARRIDFEGKHRLK